MVDVQIEAKMDVAGVFRPIPNENETASVGVHVFNVDVNAVPMVIAALTAGQRVIVTKIKLLEKAAGSSIILLQENGVTVWRRLVGANEDVEIDVPPILLSTVGNVTLTAVAGLTLDASVEALRWTERTV